MNEYPELTGLLDGLIKTLKDGEQGFQEAAKDVESVGRYLGMNE